VPRNEHAGAQNASDVKRRILAGMVKKTTIGWEPTCGCPPAPLSLSKVFDVAIWEN
jgi:hypothetical protein